MKKKESKMRTITRAVKLLGYLTISASLVGAGYVIRARREPKVWPLPTIEQIQLRIGAKVDGKLGSETERLWRRAEFNSYANKYMTPSGKQRKGD